jgi:hypothetical protein
MFSNNAKLIFVTLLFVFMISACSSQADATPVVAPLPETASIVPELSSNPDEFLRFSSNQSYETSPFALEGSGGLRVYWKQDCERFYLALVNTNEALAAVVKGTVTFALDNQPSEYIEDHPFIVPWEYIPGEYTFKVETEGECSWEVWTVLVPPEGQ